MDARDTYVDALRQRLVELKATLDRERLQVRKLLGEIGDKERQIGHIVELLAAERVTIEGEGFQGVQPMSVSDMAYAVLSRQKERRPIHYRDLEHFIMAEGRLIPGKNPAANLISHLVRDDRFVRTGRGVYGLTEWGLEPAKKRSSRRSKPRKKR